MADEDNPDTTVPTAPAPQPAAHDSEVVTMTRAELEAQRQRDRDSGAAAVRRANEGKQKQPEAKAKTAEHTEAAPVAARDQTFEDSLADAIADQKELSKEQRQMVRDYARMKKPEDVDSFVARMVSTFNITPKPNSTVTPSPAPANAAPASPPRAASPAPSTVVPGDGPERAISWSDQQVADFSGKNGGNAANPMHWSNRAAAIKVARLVEAELAGMHFTKKR